MVTEIEQIDQSIGRGDGGPSIEMTLIGNFVIARGRRLRIHANDVDVDTGDVGEGKRSVSESHCQQTRTRSRRVAAGRQGETTKQKGRAAADCSNHVCSLLHRIPD